MKIYKSDGSYIDNPTDTDFGWNLNDIIVDESIPLYDEHNRKVFTRRQTRRIRLFEDTIKTAKISSVIDFKLDDTVDEKTPQKSQICTLINPCTIESKILLSVVHYALYKNFNPNMINLEHFKNGTRLCSCENMENVIHHQIQTFNKKNLSLLMDLVMAENRCDMDELGFQNSEFLDCVDGFGRSFLGNKVFRKKTFSNSYFEKVINQSIKSIRDRTVDMDLQICEIKKSFLDEIFCVDILIHKARKLEKELREAKFLDDLICLLEGELEKVVLKESPFRIFVRGNCDEQNLIV